MNHATGTQATPALFTSFTLKDVRLRNRIAVAPMCQYAATDGVVGDWHLVHLGARAVGGAGLVIAEGTAVSPEGRITHACAGLWRDDQAEAWSRIVPFIKAQGAVPGIQLAHAGRKANTRLPAEGGAQWPADDAQAWPTLGPSAEAFGGDAPRLPQAMTLADIQRVQADFAAAARRARDAGFEWLELHFGHGYLAQSFFSPLANQRRDAHGGSFAGRARFLLDTLDAVRAVWPARLPLTIKLGVTDFRPDGHSVDESIELLQRMARQGLDLVDVSLGFNTPDVSGVPWGPGFMVPIAAQIRAASGLPVAVGWMLDDPVRANAVVQHSQADLVMLARAMLANPHWAYVAAQALGCERPWAVLPERHGVWLRH